MSIVYVTISRKPVKLLIDLVGGSNVDINSFKVKAHLKILTPSEGILVDFSTISNC